MHEFQEAHIYCPPDVSGGGAASCPRTIWPEDLVRTTPIAEPEAVVQVREGSRGDAESQNKAWRECPHQA